MAAGSGPQDRGPEEVRRFLDEALRDHVIDEATYLRLRVALEHREEIRTAFASTPPVPARPDAPLAPPSSPRPGIPAVKAPATVPPGWWKEPTPPPERAEWAAWFGRLRELVSSDLALHGLAYLGVLMVFVGVFGFVVFAYGELDPSLRPVAEATVPTACFLASWFLHRRRAPHVAVALELLGGLTLPLVAYASFVDNGPVPPDLTGQALIIALAGTSLAIGVAYAAWSVRRPTSVLRYLVAPMGWMVVWTLGLWAAGGDIAGIEIREPNLRQMAAFTLAVVFSLVLATAFPSRRFARETKVSAIGGLALGYGLVLATGFANGWEAAPVVVTAVATLVGIDLIAAGFGDRSAAGARMAQSLVVALTAAAVVPDLDPAWSGVAVVLAAIALLERWARGRVGRPEVVIVLVELGVGLAMAAREPWPTVLAFGVAAVWAHVRRMLGYAPLGLAPSAEGASLSIAHIGAALLPVGVAAGLWEALGPEQALLASAVVLLLASIAYAVVGTDVFSSAWLAISAAAVDAAALFRWFEQDASATLLAATVVVAAVLLVASPKGVPRIWLGASGIAVAGILGMDLAELDLSTRAEVGAAVGFGIVVVGAVVLGPSAVAAHLEAVGLLVGAAGLVAIVDAPGGVRLAVLGAWALGWIVVAAAGEVREPVRSEMGELLRLLAPGASLVLLALFAADAARFAGVLEDRPGALGVVFSVLALLEAAACRPIAVRRPLVQIVSWGAFGLGLVAIGFGSPERWILIVAISALIGVVLLIPAAVRAVPMMWGAWAASGALVILLAERAGMPTEQLYAAGFAWSAVVLLGALALDVRLGGARPSSSANPEIRTPWLVPPAVLGAVGLAVSLGFSTLEPPSVYGWWLIGGGAVAIAAALLVRVPWIAGVGAVLAAFGAGTLAWDLGPAPFAAVLSVEAVLTGVVASRLSGEVRTVLQFVAAGLGGGAWSQVVEAAGWTGEETRWATAVAAGVVLLAAAAAIRLRTLAADWLLSAGAVAGAGVLFVEYSLLETFDPATGSDPVWGEPSTRLALAAAFVMATIALAISAAPTERPRLREASALTAAVALANLLVGLEVSNVRSVAVLVGASVVTLVVTLALWRTATWRAWAPAIGLFSAIAAVASLAVAVGIEGDRAPLVAALFACGVEAAAGGLVLRRVELLILAPILLAGAWIAFATEIFEGNPQWFTIPIGIAALAVVEVLRWDHRRRGENVHTQELIALELAGIAFLIGASPIRVIQGSTWAGLTGVVLGMVVAVWGALTRVRRRLWLGVASVVGCLLLMVLVPLTQRLPDVASAAPWVLLGAIGILVVVAATALERGRTRLRAAIHHIDELLDGWE